MVEYFGSVRKYKSSESILCKEYIHPRNYKFIKRNSVSNLMFLQTQNGDDILKDFIESSKNL